MVKNNKIWIAVIIIAAALIAQSCKKGCTNPSAINYKAGAIHDDASCLFCDSSVQAGGSDQNIVQDMNSASPNFGRAAISITINASQVTYAGNGCQALGKGSANGSGCPTTTYTAILNNETTSTIVVSGTIVASVGNSPNLNYAVSSVSIAPYANASFQMGQVACGDINIFNVTFQSPSFQYH
jgi:hypothetical protein